VWRGSGAGILDVQVVGCTNSLVGMPQENEAASWVDGAYIARADNRCARAVIQYWQDAAQRTYSRWAATDVQV
jgi:hypothetical protein